MFILQSSTQPTIKNALYILCKSYIYSNSAWPTSFRGFFSNPISLIESINVTLNRWLWARVIWEESILGNQSASCIFHTFLASFCQDQTTASLARSTAGLGWPRRPPRPQQPLLPLKARIVPIRCIKKSQLFTVVKDLKKGMKNNCVPLVA